MAEKKKRWYRPYLAGLAENRLLRHQLRQQLRHRSNHSLAAVELEATMIRKALRRER
jgi:hypothetical protein